MAVTVGGGGLAGAKSTVKYNAECEGWGYVFQSHAADGPKSPDGAPSVSPPFPPYMYFFVFDSSFFPSTSTPKSWSPSSLTSPRIKKPRPPAVSPWQRQASSRRGIGELPSHHQSVLQILAKVSQKPWAASKPSLQCDTFGWCVLPWGCWTLRQTSCSGTQHCLQSSEERSLLSLPIREIDIIWTCWASSWLFSLVFYRDTASEVFMSVIIRKYVLFIWLAANAWLLSFSCRDVWQAAALFI